MRLAKKKSPGERDHRTRRGISPNPSERIAKLRHDEAAKRRNADEFLMLLIQEILRRDAQRDVVRSRKPNSEVRVEKGVGLDRSIVDARRHGKSSNVAAA